MIESLIKFSTRYDCLLSWQEFVFVTRLLDRNDFQSLNFYFDDRLMWWFIEFLEAISDCLQSITNWTRVQIREMMNININGILSIGS